MRRYTVYTDGASSFAGKENAVAGWSLVIPDVNNRMFVRYGNLPGGTNNHGELMGALYLMHLFHDKEQFGFDIFSDSQYLVKGINEWKRAWKSKQYQGVKNTNLIIPLHQMWEKHGNNTVTWVRGHDGNEGNELADHYCVMGKKLDVINIDSETQNIKYVEPYQIPYLNQKG